MNKIKLIGFIVFLSAALVHTCAAKDAYTKDAEKKEPLEKEEDVSYAYNGTVLNLYERSVWPDIKNPEKITKLSIDKCSEDILEGGIAQLVNLEVLYISRSNIKKLPAEISQLKHLRTISLFRMDVWPIIENPEKITEIMLDRCIEEVVVNAITQLVNLEVLYISRSNIKKLPAEVFRLKRLKTLSILKAIEELPVELFDMVNLESLGVATTGIEYIPPQISRLTKLKGLFLTGNHSLKVLPPQIGDLSNLKGLDISNNDLRDLPVEITKLHKLDYLNLGDNPDLVIKGKVAQWIKGLKARGAEVILE